MQISERHLRETARDYACRVIKQNIISLALVPGSMVSENELSAQLGLSRTPVREALIELGKTQLVEILPQRGSRISLIDYEHVDESRFVRLVMENAVVELLCTGTEELDFSRLDENLRLQEMYLKDGVSEKLMEIDDAFHRELFRLCGKMQTYQLVNSMAAHFDRVRSMSITAVRDTKLVSDHSAVVEAIRCRDASAAKELMTQHLSRYKIDKDAIRAQYPGYFKRTSEA